MQKNSSHEFNHIVVVVKHSKKQRYHSHPNANTDVTNLYQRMISFGCVRDGITKNITDLLFFCAMSAPKRLRNINFIAIFGDIW